MNISLNQTRKSQCGPNGTKKSAVFTFLAITIFAITVSAITLANASQAAHLYQSPLQGIDQEELLWWLPSDTESVVVARGPFPLPVPLDDENWDKRKVSQAVILQEFEQQALELLYSDSLNVATRLRGSTVAFAVQGSRHFREPLPDLEVMDFEGCSIVIFDERFGERGNSLMQTLAKTATTEKTIGGVRILVFHQKLGNAEWDYFLALPRSNVLLAANNLSYLQEVLEHMTQRKSPRAFPEQLPEWRFLDPAARVWGLRHYDRTQAEQDPTSPFSDDRTFGPGDQKAIGILFALEPNNQKEAVTTYLSGDEAMVKAAVTEGTSSEEALIASFNGHEVITSDGMTFEDRNPEKGVKYDVKLWSPAPGVLERVYTLARPGTLSYFTLQMQISLGRGMYF